jgi:hypothetical protein
MLIDFRVNYHVFTQEPVRVDRVVGAVVSRPWLHCGKGLPKASIRDNRMEKQSTWVRYIIRRFVALLQAFFVKEELVFN